jgi:hypothetical protein
MRILLIFLIVFLFYIIQGRLYIKNCFKNVQAELKFNLPGIFQGEKAELVEVFLNKKLMPLWWVGVKFAVSRYLVFEEERNENEGNDNYRKDMFFLMPYEKVRKKFTITGARRGYYIIANAELNSSDLFGVYRVIRSFPCSAQIYVYPKLISEEEIDIQFKRMSGEILTKRHLLEDPFQLRGIREYQPYDSLKTVNWNATAKSGELKVNQYDFTASQKVMIFLNIERYNAWDPEKIVEESISLAASLVTRYIKLGMQVELVSNGLDAVSGERVRVSSGGGMAHNIEIYESLARLDINSISGPVANIVESETACGNRDNVYILISHYFGDKLVGAVGEARLRGLDIKWILPKTQDTRINFELDNDLFIWEVREK